MIERCQYSTCSHLMGSNSTGWYTEGLIICPDHIKACTYKCVACDETEMALSELDMPMMWRKYKDVWYCPQHRNEPERLKSTSPSPVNWVPVEPGTPEPINVTINPTAGTTINITINVTPQ